MRKVTVRAILQATLLLTIEPESFRLDRLRNYLEAARIPLSEPPFRRSGSTSRFAQSTLRQLRLARGVNLPGLTQ